MLQLRIRFLLNLKGITNPYNFLINQGFTPNVSSRILNGKMEQIKLSQINSICKILQCTPNDLLQWTPSKDEALPEDHPLNSLIRNDKPFNIIGQINHLSLDQIKEVEQFISKIKSDSKGK